MDPTLIKKKVLNLSQYMNNYIYLVTANINGEIVYVPMNPANTHYAEILRQVAAGELTIADAD